MNADKFTLKKYIQNEAPKKYNFTSTTCYGLTDFLYITGNHPMNEKITIFKLVYINNTTHSHDVLKEFVYTSDMTLEEAINGVWGLLHEGVAFVSKIIVELEEYKQCLKEEEDNRYMEYLDY